MKGAALYTFERHSGNVKLKSSIDNPSVRVGTDLDNELYPFR